METLNDKNRENEGDGQLVCNRQRQMYEIIIYCFLVYLKDEKLLFDRFFIHLQNELFLVSSQKTKRAGKK